MEVVSVEVLGEYKDAHEYCKLIKLHKIPSIVKIEKA